MPLTAPQVAALSVAETCNSYLKDHDKKVGLKWINDVFYGDKKIAGMLCQSSVQGDEKYLTVGIGINLNTSPIESGISLQEILKQKIDVQSFFEKLTINVVKNFKLLDIEGF